MNQIIETIVYYFQYPFVRYALIVGVLIALCSSLLGVTLVLKRFSLIGDGLSHVAFGAIAVSAILGMGKDINMFFVLPVTVAAAVLLLKNGQKSRIHGDAAVAMLSVGSLAAGYMLMNLFYTGANLSGDVCTTLFGSTSILTLTKAEVVLSIVLAAAVILIFILFYNRLFAVTFDEDFAKASGMRTQRYNLLIAVVVAVIIVLAMNLVGSLLISALVIFPALTAMRIWKSFLSVTVASCVISVVCAVIGILTAIVAGTPVGSTIVVINMACFVIVFLVSGSRRTLIACGAAVIPLFLLSGCGGNAEDRLTNKSAVQSVLDEKTEGSQSEDTSSEDDAGSQKTVTSVQAPSGSFTSVQSSADNTDQIKIRDLVDRLSAEDMEKAGFSQSPDMDLTKYSTDLLYSTIFQVNADPEAYKGKRIRIAGKYHAVFDDRTNQYYQYCLVQDVTACCVQGMEFIWDDGSHVYPDEYPEENKYIVVEGTFETYNEDGIDTLFSRLSDARLLIIGDGGED